MFLKALFSILYTSLILEVTVVWNQTPLCLISCRVSLGGIWCFSEKTLIITHQTIRRHIPQITAATRRKSINSVVDLIFIHCWENSDIASNITQLRTTFRLSRGRKCASHGVIWAAIWLAWAIRRERCKEFRKRFITDFALVILNFISCVLLCIYNINVLVPSNKNVFIIV